MAYDKTYGDYRSAEATEANAAAVAYRNMFGWMACALGLSALTAWFTMDRIMNSSAFAEFLFGNGKWILMIASFALVIGLGAGIQRLSMSTATLLFALYSVIMGAWITPVLLLYTSTSVTQVFLITAGTFGGMALYGHIAKADLSKLGNILIMALWGIILASVVNIFMHSTMLHYIISYVGVLLFCGLTMYDVQRFKNSLFDNDMLGEESLQKIALLGALSLYMDFLNLFLYLLRILGDRK